MKTTKIIFALLLFSITFVQCSKDNATDPVISAEETTANAKLDQANDDVLDLVEEEENNTYLNPVNGKTTSSFTTNTCATITRVPAFGTPLTLGMTVTKTIDFGTTPCTLPNGNTVSGVIVISFVYNPNATSHTITYTLNNFYHNLILFNGTKTFTRVVATSTLNPNLHPIVTMNMDFTATFPNGNVYHRVGTRVREIIEGQNTVIWTDNIYSITGNWTTTLVSTGAQTTHTITTPLKIRMSCVLVNKPVIVMGVITIVKNNNTATLDYGNGDCDNVAILTLNGVTFTINI